jgi:hypothetical protein
MKFALLIISLLASSLALAAERAVIQQMKGKRAILQFEKDIPFSVGQKVYLNSEDGTELGVSKEGRNFLERKNSIEMAVDIYSTDIETKVSSVTSKTSLSGYTMTGRYGWNRENFEFGPLAELTYVKPKSSDESSRYAIGGFFDYNFVPNKPGEDFIWGAFGEGIIGSSKVGTSNKSITGLNGGGFIKWFFLSPMLALRTNLYISYEKQGDNAQSTTTGVQLGFSHYF